MFCGNCGTKLEDGAKFCHNCGAAQQPSVPVDNLKATIDSGINNAESQVRSAIGDVKATFDNLGAPYMGERLQTDRSLIAYIVLSIITCGIYGYYFIYKMAYDVNIACEGDGETTGGLVAFLLFNILTCGLYSWYWYYTLGNRLAANSYRYGMSFQENGTTILMWCIIGVFMCGLGPFIAMNILIKNTNKICQGYNDLHGLV